MTFSGFSLFCSIPLWVIIPALIRLEDGGPIFFEQKRVGKGGKLFVLHKFRSMIPNAEGAGEAVMASSKDPRITRVGCWLRKTALDELPQLVNIWRGEMSFVGPRALRESERMVIDDAETLVNLSEIEGYALRQSVRPGLTGMAQVYAARDITHRYKFKYDLLYVKKKNFWLDMKLVGLSFWYTFTARWHV